MKLPFRSLTIVFAIALVFSAGRLHAEQPVKVKLRVLSLLVSESEEVVLTSPGAASVRPIAIKAPKMRRSDFIDYQGPRKIALAIPAAGVGGVASDVAVTLPKKSTMPLIVLAYDPENLGKVIGMAIDESLKTFPAGSFLAANRSNGVIWIRVGGEHVEIAPGRSALVPAKLRRANAVRVEVGVMPDPEPASKDGTKGSGAIEPGETSDAKVDESQKNEAPTVKLPRAQFSAGWDHSETSRTLVLVSGDVTNKGRVVVQRINENAEF